MIFATASLYIAAYTPVDSRMAVQQEVVNFAADQVGQTVGQGQCADLAVHALNKANAKPYGTWKDYPSAGDYVWGEQVGEIKNETNKLRLEPGDILQFRDVKIVSKSGFATITYTASHHTAIVESYAPQNGELKIFQQNSRGRSYVSRDTLILKDIKSGTIWAYRAVPK